MSSSKNNRTWKKVHDDQLANLIRRGPYKGGIGINDLTPAYIDAIREEHFAWYTIGKNFRENFRKLYRKKIRKWNLNETLSGARQEREDGKEDKRQKRIDSMSKFCY